MSKIDYQALREAAEKAGEDKWQAKKINGDFFVIRHGSYTRQHGYTSYQPIAEIDCSQSGILLPRLIRLPCLRFLMNWKLKANALQSWRKKLHQIRLASSVKIFEHRIIE